MVDNRPYVSDDVQLVRDLITENPWATVVSATDTGLLASHYPVLLDDGPQLALLMHVGRPDEQLHAFGASEVMIIIAGANGYISPSWYPAPAKSVPTWNFIVAHCYGTPEPLSDDENQDLLLRLTAHFEVCVESPVQLESDVLARLGPRAAGFRVPIERFICKVKMSQDEDPNTQVGIRAALRRPGPYSNPALANQMESPFRYGSHHRHRHLGDHGQTVDR